MRQDATRRCQIDSPHGVARPPHCTNYNTTNLPVFCRDAKGIDW
ncbi:hypothetical protein PLANPX_6081 [Lacipirellula parvula]|uniref:Uncharacterized protein n=1 Tax=Lacipirellula parvula TaxID=2650471 RepID=A0A5K7XRD1_9BACT|nr:hypothetical protein PLANPX_6081 [Lacipirellula parvula]